MVVVAGCSSESNNAAVSHEDGPNIVADTPPLTDSPVSAEMRRELRRLAELMPIAEFEILESKQQQWLAQRERHCATSAELATNTEEAKLIVVECRRDSDAQVLPRLRNRHFKLLAAEPVPQTPRSAIDAAYESIRSPGHAQAMHINEHAGQLVIAAGRTIYGLDASNGDRVWGATAAERSNTRIAVSPNGRILVTGSRDDTLLRFWDAETGDFLFDIDVAHKDAPFAFLADGRYVVIGAQKLMLFDLNTSRQRPVQQGASKVSAIAVNDKYIAVGTRRSEIITYSIERTLEGIDLDLVHQATAAVPRSPLVALFTSSDGLHLTTVTRSGVIGRWLLPDLGRVSSAHSELRNVGVVATTDKSDILFLSGNTADRGARGRVLAIDVEGGLSKRLYEEARTSGPAIALAEESGTLYIGDGTTLAAVSVSTSVEGFDNMESLADGALADVQITEETQADRLGRTGTRAKSSLGGISDDTKVHVVGVYEGELPNGKKRGFREHAQGQVTVNVGGSGRAILVLSAYEPVKWTVVPRGIFIDHILLFGYYDQEVNAPPGARVYTNLQSSVGGSSMYAYKKDGNYAKLERAVREITGVEIDTFQGKYRAGSFSVNTGGLPSDSTQDPRIEKWVDEDGVVHYGDSSTINKR